MSAPLHLRIATPARVVVDSGAVRSLRARDESGSFGILPGHADLLTVLPASVVAWRETGADAWRYCAVRGGVLSVSGGNTVLVAGREAVPGADLEELEGVVHAAREAETEADRKARVEQMRFHTQAVRHLVRYLMPTSRRGMDSGLPDKDWP